MSIYRCSDFLLFCNLKNTRIKSFLYRQQILQLVKLVRDESLHFSPEKCRLSSRTKWYEQYYSISVENGPKTTYGNWSYVPGSTFRCRLFPEKPVLVQTFVYYLRVLLESFIFVWYHPSNSHEQVMMNFCFQSSPLRTCIVYNFLACIRWHNFFHIIAPFI